MKKQLVVLSTSLALAACGDDIDNSNPDAPPQGDAPIDAPLDAPPSWTAPAASSLQWSATANDRAYSVAVDSLNRFYVAGFRATNGVNGDRHVIVTRLLANGTPDPTFATGGTFDTGVVFVGADDEIDIVKVGNTDVFVLSATVAAATTNPSDAADTDIALIKLRLNGTTSAAELDTTFGGGDGIAVHSLNTSALNNGTAFGRDHVRGIDARSNGEIFIHGGARANGNQMGTSTPRVDTDFIVAKFLADGTAFDTNFSTDGMVETDIYFASTHLNATARGLLVVGSGTVLAGGYAGGNGTGPTEGPQPVLYRLNADGTRDTAFAPTSTVPGVLYTQVLTEQAEVYNFARQVDGGTTYLVTGGYGRNDSATNINDWVSFRYNAATGARDTTWGAATNGAVTFDPTPANTAAGSNCRNAIALPGGKTILLGSSNRDVTTGALQNQDAVFAVLGANGALDTSYGNGIATYMLGNDGQDAFWGGAANNTHALIVGWRGASVSPAVDTNNDDAYAVLLPLE